MKPKIADVADYLRSHSRFVCVLIRSQDYTIHFLLACIYMLN